ncbi:MAG: hypothetical protein NZZ41_07240 [Candidatus Dojkabacteria bacterium]|nr:hypothetical protein [Candidatus Dojkabacteria bacterium]
MKVTCKVFPIGKPAASDGSIFTRNVIDEFLKSDLCKHRLQTKTCVGAITHIHRDKKLIKSEIVAVVDQMLLNKAITHYVTDFYIEGDWLMADMKMLDENLMDSQSAENIKFIKGLLLNGIEIPVSATVIANWTGNKATKLIDIPGIDFTLDPGFDYAGVVKINDIRKQ